MKMKLWNEGFFAFRKTVTFKDVKIYHETETSILVELHEQSVWLPKNKIKVNKQNSLAEITIPIDFIRKKFPAHKYKQFSDY